MKDYSDYEMMPRRPVSAMACSRLARIAETWFSTVREERKSRSAILYCHG
jgi:hypothetical protein